MHLNTADYSFLSQRQRMSPFPNYLSLESVCKEMKEYVGVSLKDTLMIIK